MKIKIDEIRINAGRREARADNIQELADSIAEIGLLNPITISQDKMLIAGRHRLEAAKLLGWTEIECTVSEVSDLLAELAEIDENVVRTNLSVIEFGNLLLRRKHIYETLHPETKKGGDRKSEEIKAKKLRSDFPKSFVKDTAEKLGVTPRTVETQIQTARNLTPGAKAILEKCGYKINKSEALKLSRMKPDQQEDVASLLAADKITSVDEYIIPYSAGGKFYATLEESIVDLKNPDKDCSYTADSMLIEMDGFISRCHRAFCWHDQITDAGGIPKISQEQFEYISRRFASVISKIEEMLEEIKQNIEEGQD